MQRTNRRAPCDTRYSRTAFAGPRQSNHFSSVSNNWKMLTGRILTRAVSRMRDNVTWKSSPSVWQVSDDRDRSWSSAAKLFDEQLRSLVLVSPVSITVPTSSQSSRDYWGKEDKYVSWHADRTAHLTISSRSSRLGSENAGRSFRWDWPLASFDTALGTREDLDSETEHDELIGKCEQTFSTADATGVSVELAKKVSPWNWHCPSMVLIERSSWRQEWSDLSSRLVVPRSLAVRRTQCSVFVRGEVN